MLYWLSDYQDTFQFFNLFRYITWRTGGAMMTAAIFMFIAGSPIIDWLRAAQGKKAELRIGTEVPLPITSFTVGTTGGVGGGYLPATSATIVVKR